MNIIFMGTPHFARVILESLHKDSHFYIKALITQEDKPFGRKKELKMPPCKEFIVSHNLKIPILQPQNLQDIFNDVSALKPHAIIVAAYGKILPKSFIENFTCVNIHASILPKYRGASPIQSMILHDEKYIGISVIKMDSKLDSGEILAMRFMKNQHFDIIEAGEILAKNGAELVMKVLKSDSILPLPQIHADSTYCQKIKKEHGMVDFTDAKQIYTRYLAYKSWPQVFLDSRLKLFDIELCDTTQHHNAGEILEISDDSARIGCKNGSIRIKSIQAPSKNKIDVVSYLHGKRLNVGDILT